MPWCPKCKNEYREDITECTECKVPLVETYEEIVTDENAFVTVFTSEKKELLEKFIEYLDYSGITRHSLTTDEYELIWSVNVCEDDFTEARKLYKGFSIAENEKAFAETINAMQAESEDTDDILSEDSEDENTQTSFDDDEAEIEPDKLSNEAIEKIAENDLMDELHGASNTYVRKADQFKDYQFSALTCVLCGVAGILFCILNLTGIINVLPALFSQLVMLVVFGIFLISGTNIYVKSTQIKTQIDDQVDVEGQVTTWLDTNITTDYLETIKDVDVSDEINYFNYSETVKKWLLSDLPFADEAMAEAMIEEHFNKIM